MSCSEPFVITLYYAVHQIVISRYSPDQSSPLLLLTGSFCLFFYFVLHHLFPLPFIFQYILFPSFIFFLCLLFEEYFATSSFSFDFLVFYLWFKWKSSLLKLPTSGYECPSSSLNSVFFHCLSQSGLCTSVSLPSVCIYVQFVYNSISAGVPTGTDSLRNAPATALSRRVSLSPEKTAGSSFLSAA